MKYLLAFFVSFCLAVSSAGVTIPVRKKTVNQNSNNKVLNSDAAQINPANCGMRSNEVSSLRRKRFLSASRSNQKDFGWVVLLEGVNGVTSGSLINSQWVLTHAKDIE
jgi:hypothetical protein